MTTVLMVWAHPDDEAFGPAGLVRSLHERGVRLVMVTATCGEAGNLGNPPRATRETLGKVRAEELRLSARILGIDELLLWDYPDGRVQHVNHSRFRQRLLKLFAAERPSAVLTFGPDGVYGHPDHIAVSTLTTQAFAQYLAANPAQEPRLYYVTADPDQERLPPNAAGSDDAPPPSPPTTVVDVADFAEIKRQALAAHASQHADWERVLGQAPPRWLTHAFLHRAYPPLPPSAPLETDILE